MRDQVLIILLVISIFSMGALILVAVTLFINNSDELTPDVVSEISSSSVWISYSWTGLNHAAELVEGSNTGSGVIAANTPNGIEIYTNRHVIDCGYVGECGMRVNEQVRIRTDDGNLHHIKNIRYAPSGIDLAIITIPARDEYRAAAAAHNTQTQRVVTVGYPSYADGVVEFRIDQGEVINRKKLITNEGIAITSIESDAYTHAGSSGGGLFDTNGELIGISTWAGEGFSTAIELDSIPPIKSFIACESGHFLYDNKHCAPFCASTAILTENLECVELCEGFYCKSDAPQVTSNSCPAGYVSDSGGSCRPACNGRHYCQDENAWCYENNCVTCPNGRELYKDGLCY